MPGRLHLPPPPGFGHRRRPELSGARPALRAAAGLPELCGQRDWRYMNRCIEVERRHQNYRCPDTAGIADRR